MPIVATGDTIEDTHHVPKGVVAIIPAPGVPVSVPGYTEINGQTTLECCRSLSEEKAKHILTGALLPDFFYEVFEKDVPIPQNRAALLKASHDVQHIIGMIILLFEAKFERGENVFLREPETHLHPAQCYGLMTMLSMFGVGDQPPRPPSK